MTDVTPCNVPLNIYSYFKEYVNTPDKIWICQHTWQNMNMSTHLTKYEHVNTPDKIWTCQHTWQNMNMSTHLTKYEYVNTPDKIWMSTHLSTHLTKYVNTPDRNERHTWQSLLQQRADSEWSLLVTGIVTTRPTPTSAATGRTESVSGRNDWSKTHQPSENNLTYYVCHCE